MDLKVVSPGSPRAMAFPLSPPWTTTATPKTDIDAKPDTAPCGSSTAAVDPCQIPLPIEVSDDGPDSLELSIRDPIEIPLPASPAPTKSSLPFRGPRTAVPPPSRRITSNARTPSGRRVSGALQYALQPDIERQVSGTSSLDLAYNEQMRDQLSDLGDDTEIHETDEVFGLEEHQHLPVWDSTLGFGGEAPPSDESISQMRNDDEAWMSYVRQQLNTLFPDLFNAEADADADANAQSFMDPSAGDTPYMAGDIGDISISTISTLELPTPPPSGLGYSGMGGGMPNVREEIGGLRDEIERLRGVVSGLGEGLRAPPISDPAEARVVEDRRREDVKDGEDRPIPDAFYKTAGLSANIIKLLDTKVNVHGRAPDGARTDEAVFSEENLSSILSRLETMSL